MPWVRALLNALELQLEIVHRVRADDLDLPSRCAGWTIRDVLNHSLGVTHKFADFASGATDEPHAPPGDLLGRDHRVATTSAVGYARAAWSTADMTRTCHLRFGTFSAEAAAGINLFDVLAHTWDVAAAVPMDLDEDNELWVIGLDAARQVIGSSRDHEQYGAEVRTSLQAPAMHDFLPSWDGSPSTVPDCRLRSFASSEIAAAMSSP